MLTERVDQRKGNYFPHFFKAPENVTTRSGENALKYTRKV